MRAFLNPAVDRSGTYRGLFSEHEYREVQTYYSAHPELAPTPLQSVPTLASASAIGRIDAKNETARFGLNAFKILGVHYAVDRLGEVRTRRGLVCATAGNHGRAVARVARERGVRCTVFIPAARNITQAELRTRTSRISAIRGDGADVIEVHGTYEEAVRLAAAHGAETGATIVSDTSWPGYEQIPRWIMAGYTRLFDEARTQWDAPPDVVVVQGGVGGLVCAAVSWFAWNFDTTRPFFISCEPDNAACLLESGRAGKRVVLDGSLDTIMAGLRCAEPSPLAWQAIARGVDAFVSIDDGSVAAAMNALANAPDGERIVAGPSGACGAAAIVACAHAPELADVRGACRLDRSTRALIVITEGA